MERLCQRSRKKIKLIYASSEISNLTATDASGKTLTQSEIIRNKDQKIKDDLKKTDNFLELSLYKWETQGNKIFLQAVWNFHLKILAISSVFGKPTVTEGRLFCRQYSFSQNSWRNALKENQKAYLKVNVVIIEIGRKTPDDLNVINEKVDEAYIDKYVVQLNYYPEIAKQSIKFEEQRNSIGELLIK